MMEFLSVNTIFFTIAGYPMSYIEFFGTALNLSCVYLVAKNKILNWPIGILAVVLFFILFYEIRLYSDMVEQAYFFVTGFWGWYMWSRRKKTTDTNAAGQLQVSVARRKEIIWSAAVIFVGTVTLGRLMSNIHLVLPDIFLAPADYPYLDALTTVMSFVATVLMVRRKYECWYLWIAVDFIGIWLYWVKGVKFISVEYMIFLVLASYGLYKWHLILKERQEYEAVSDRGGSREILPAPSRT
ncbi:MAG: nicotinamide riboside transporter PnuC [Patescibacteria group bacterium]